MSRLKPKESIVKKLFALSGNICAHTNCDNNLVSKNGALIGQICHIEAAEKGGERYNDNMSDEDRRGIDNLIILCANCHVLTNDVNSYPTSILRGMKKSHELKFANNPFQASNKLIEESILNIMKQKNTNTGNGIQINTQGGNNKVNIYASKENRPLNVDGFRKVNQELKDIIDTFKQPTSPKEQMSIDFKNELSEGRLRDVELVPIKYLKFRKDNGRIRSEIESIEKTIGTELDETEPKTQEIIKNMLLELSPDDNLKLKQLIKHKTQRVPAIVTCDGFMIDGNRRKLVIEELYHESGENPKYENMKVIFLDENVSNIDIQKIENRYQLQSEGKKEYSGLNKALTYRRNKENGFSLKAQLKDDPGFSDVTERKAINKIEKEYLQPLELVDRYLDFFDKPRVYNTISQGDGDKEGRWQAFVDFSNFYHGTLLNDTNRQKLGIDKNEVGKIENAVFKIIRKRSLNSKEVENALGKVHEFIRKLKFYLGSKSDSKSHLLEIVNIDDNLPEEEKYDKDKNRYSEREIDLKWGKKHEKTILGNLMQAYKAAYNKGEGEKPKDLLEAALKKLEHDNLKIDNLHSEYYNETLKLIKKIINKAEKLKEEVDHARGRLMKLKNKK